MKLFLAGGLNGNLKPCFIKTMKLYEESGKFEYWSLFENELYGWGYEIIFGR